MIKVYSKALDSTISCSRIIGELVGSQQGPTIVFFAGIHGNEPAGVFALNQLLKELNEKENCWRGKVYAIAGNLAALENGTRYQKEDLNRMWSELQIKELVQKDETAFQQEASEQKEIFQLLQKILKEDTGPFYFMDLHTTSSQTVPFITVNDSLINRAFTKHFPCPIILGIEEYLDGPLLSYINELGYVSFGFEGGQHDDLAAIENHKAFAYLCLFFTGFLGDREDEYKKYLKIIVNASPNLNGFFEIYYRYQIQPNERFEMKPGYQNFQWVNKGDLLAYSNGSKVTAQYSSRVFMPLYQKQGEDGFFAIRGISNWILKFSTFLRKFHVDQILPLLPGVDWYDENRVTLRINKKIARFFAKDIMHLLGYRSRTFNKDFLLVKNREAKSKTGDYKNEAWF